jgi:hypothetical protein
MKSKALDYLKELKDEAMECDHHLIVDFAHSRFTIALESYENLNIFDANDKKQIEEWDNEIQRHSHYLYELGSGEE